MEAADEAEIEALREILALKLAADEALIEAEMDDDEKAAAEDE
jgi:hypothetical protein